MQHILIANFANNSIAMIQWAVETLKMDFCVVSVDTGWASVAWQSRYQQMFQFIDKHHIEHIHLPSKPSFVEAVKDRNSFPSKKFQWCAPFLKGLAINNYLDETDPFCEATVYLSKMRIQSRANQALVSGEANEHFQDRILAYPLLDLSLEARDQLIQKTNLPFWQGPSQECLPCIHTSTHESSAMSSEDKHRLQQLETDVSQTMVLANTQPQTDSERYDMGCGNIWGCGD